MRRSNLTATLLVIVALVVFTYSDFQVVSSYYDDDSPLSGPYIDEVVYKWYRDPDQKVLALQEGEIDLDDTYFSPTYYQILNADPDISIHETERKGYGQITINCEKYPLNISGFRRAFAFAYNKTKATWEILGGFGIEHDSIVPRPIGWCIEDQFNWHYYDARADIGNQILDELGFDINITSGFRLAPNGSAFDIEMEYSSSSPEIGGGVAQLAVEALTALHINATAVPADFNEYISRLDNHEDYDMVFYAVNFYSNDVHWLASDYWSSYADVYQENPSNFRNATYDLWSEQLLYGTTYEEVYEAAAEMQKILHYNVPRLVVYTNTYLQGYRNDVFTGHIESILDSICNQWTIRKMRKVDGTLGGSVSVAIELPIDIFNFFVVDSSFSGPYYRIVFQSLWSSLYKYGPDQTPWSDLAENLLIETHSDNAAVPEGHTRFTIDIIRNATWSDGTPLTAEDVAFTYQYQYGSAAYGNPAGADMENLFAAAAPTPYRVVLEYSTESYWHFSDFAFDYIIPYHIFNDVDGIGYEGWNTWNPVYNVTDPHVNCGPFIFSTYENDEYYILEWNPMFHYAPELTTTTETYIPTIITSTPTPTTIESNSPTTGTGQTSGAEMPWSMALSTSIGAISLVVILYCSVLILRERLNVNPS